MIRPLGMGDGMLHSAPTQRYFFMRFFGTVVMRRRQSLGHAQLEFLIYRSFLDVSRQNDSFEVLFLDKHTKK